MAGARSCCARRDVGDEQPADSPPHRVGLDEEVVELASPAADGQHDREAEKPPEDVDRNPHASVGDGALWRLDRIRVRSELGRDYKSVHREVAILTATGLIERRAADEVAVGWDRAVTELDLAA